MTQKIHYKQEEVVSKIISLLEHGNLNWIKSWKTGLPKNFKSKKEYKGINSIVLNLVMQDKGYKLPYFLSYLQVQGLGGSVRAGEKSVSVFFYQMKERDVETKNEDGSTSMLTKKYPLLRVYQVFNVEQTTIEVPAEAKLDFKPIELAENQIANYVSQIKIVFGGSRAFYSPSEDFIGMPIKESFVGAEEYYSTLNHELSHSTGSEKRLARDTIKDLQMFGDNDYSKEEVIAELSACFLCASAGIENKTIKNSSAYLGRWIENMKQDKTFIFKVIGQAQKSADLILNFGKVAK